MKCMELEVLLFQLNVACILCKFRVEVIRMTKMVFRGMWDVRINGRSIIVRIIRRTDDMHPTDMLGSVCGAMTAVFLYNGKLAV